MFWTAARQNRVGVSLLIALIVAIAATLVGESARTSMLLSGDFPGFYVLAEILERGLTEKLYDPALQRQIENELWPSFDGSFYMSVYPPYLAVLLRPLAYMTPGVAQLCWTSVMVLSFLGAFFIGTAKEEKRPRSRVFYLASLVLFAPIGVGVLGGQNTALSMFILTASVALLERKKVTYDLLAGVLLALWLFKPQFGAFGLFAFGVLGYRPYVLASGGIVTFLLYLLGTTIAGFNWPLEWVTIASAFGDQNYVSNRGEMVSIAGFLKAIAYEVGQGPQTVGWSAVGYIAASLCVALVIDALVSLKRVSPDRRLKYGTLLFGAVLPLLSPQTLFYDLGITAAAFLGFLAPRDDRSVWAWLLVVVASVVAFFVRLETHLPVYFLFSASAYVLARRATRASS